MWGYQDCILERARASEPASGSPEGVADAAIAACATWRLTLGDCISRCQGVDGPTVVRGSDPSTRIWATRIVREAAKGR
ncbi:MAG TPA: hypothetical protein VG166_08980 [Caulobacteraceae bacterium]|jgi:hypothetical protein|nr:hypothetical protein [Caulobacteraceae bacterium]